MRNKGKNAFMLVYVLLLSTAITAKADGFFSGGFRTGHLTYGVEAGSKYIAQTAANQWNGVSSKVSLTYSNETNMFGSKADIIMFCDNMKPTFDGLLGEMIPYKTWTGTSANMATVDEVWVKAVVYQYKSTILNNRSKKIHTATHEIGHALGIKHPETEFTNGIPVMRQGARESYELTAYDILALKAKWKDLYNK